MAKKKTKTLKGTDAFLTIGGKKIAGMSYKPKLDPAATWLVMKDALMEKGFDLAFIDDFMKQYVKAWFHKNLGHISEYSMEMHNEPIYSMLGNGYPEMYARTEATTTLTIRGQANPEALELLRTY